MIAKQRWDNQKRVYNIKKWIFKVFKCVILILTSSVENILKVVKTYIIETLNKIKKFHVFNYKVFIWVEGWY